MEILASCKVEKRTEPKSMTMLLTDTPKNCVEFMAAYISSAISLSVYVKSFSDLFFHLSRSIVLLKASATLHTASYASGASW